MKNYILLLTAALTLTACNKKYKYVETVQEKSILSGSTIQEKESKEISAPSDSAAYLDAFQKFCISLKVYNDMQKKGMADYLDVPLGFKLYNNKGEDITDIVFYTKAEQMEIISARILSMENIVDGTKEKTPQQESKVDSAKIKELLPFFEVKKDEFDPKGLTWYTPKSAPTYTSQNGIYLYFNITEGKPGPLRFRIQYYASDWLFFKKVQFAIDEKAYEYIPAKTETDNGHGGMIWEWFDEALTSSDRDLIYALSTAKSAKMKFIGRQYHNIKVIDNKQIEDINRALELYKAMGGIY
ncbi:MAG: hypothetical protein IJ527_00410 [Prevotella sp.]|nr:hypothetical protein [Prevotella sp.]